jgi:hypothetical protein
MAAPIAYNREATENALPVEQQRAATKRGGPDPAETTYAKLPPYFSGFGVFRSASRTTICRWLRQAWI